MIPYRLLLLLPTDDVGLVVLVVIKGPFVWAALDSYAPGMNKADHYIPGMVKGDAYVPGLVAVQLDAGV
jgi:hypothetical protein